MIVGVRLAAEADLPAINSIYNHYVLHATCTYQVTPETEESRRRWFIGHDEKHPVTVAVVSQDIVGWGALNVFNAREAYSRTVENSVYVHPNWQRRGIGGTLLRDLIARARLLEYHTIVAGISAEQSASIGLHEAHGFVRAGHIREVGHKFGEWLDVLTYQLIL